MASSGEETRCTGAQSLPRPFKIHARLCPLQLVPGSRQVQLIRFYMRMERERMRSRLGESKPAGE